MGRVGRDETIDQRGNLQASEYAKNQRQMSYRMNLLEHLEALFKVQRSQMASSPVETLFITRQEDNDPNLFFTKLVIDLAMQIIRSKWHWAPKDTTGETKGQFY